jgi:hypothetical protein
MLNRLRCGWRRHNDTTGIRREPKSMTNGTKIPQPNLPIPEGERVLPYERQRDSVLEPLLPIRWSGADVT